VIGAGNSCVIKPSEMTPNVSPIMAQLVENYLDNRYFACV